jgi:septation ring formation regulator EzrA
VLQNQFDASKQQVHNPARHVYPAEKRDGQRSESMLEKADHIMATYVEAADEFGRSAKEFLQHVNLLEQAWNAYHVAMAASAELRAVLDTRDETLGILMVQLEQAVSRPFGQPVLGEKKLEALKAEVMKASAASVGAGSTSNVKMLP